MKISSKGRYAIEALLYMAVYYGNEPVNIKPICEAINVSEKYLVQIFFILRKEKILSSVRGPKGGYSISDDLNTLTAGNIIRAVEGDIYPVACIKDKNNCKSKVKDTCATYPLWSNISNCIDNGLNNETLESLKNKFLEAQVKQ